MKIFWLIPFLATTVLSSAAPRQAPFGFKKLTIGMKFEDFLNPDDIGFSDDDSLEKSGGYTDTIAGEECFVYVSFGDYGKGLELDYIGVTAPRGAWATIRNLLITKFGKPNSAQVVTKKNGMGSAFHGQECHWSNGVATIKAEELGNKIDECRIVWSRRNLDNSLAARRKAKKAAGDI